MNSKLSELLALSTKSPADFDKKPSGYQEMNEALIASLCFSESVEVRKAIAASPLLRSKFVFAMALREENAEVRAILASRQ